MKFGNRQNYSKQLELGSTVIPLGHVQGFASERCRGLLVIGFLDENGAYADRRRICVDLAWFSRVEVRQSWGAG